MENAEKLRHSIAVKVNHINNIELLDRISKVIDSISGYENQTLTNEQIEMLEMSEMDILNGSVTSHDVVFENERKWLSSK